MASIGRGSRFRSVVPGEGTPLLDEGSRNRRKAKGGKKAGAAKAAKANKRATKEDKKGRTPLMRAAKRGDLDKLLAALEAGANVNKTAGRNLADVKYSAIQFAYVHGHVDCVQALAEHGATLTGYISSDTSGGDSDLSGGTIITHAVSTNNFEMLEAMLGHLSRKERGKVLNEGTRRSRSAVSQAAKDGNVEMMRYLVEHLDAKPTGYEVALAARHGHVDMLAYLVQELGIKPEGSKARLKQGRDKDGLSPLAAAAVNGKVDAVAWLLAHGVKRDEKFKWPDAPSSGPSGKMTAIEAATAQQEQLEAQGAASTSRREKHKLRNKLQAVQQALELLQ